MDDLLNKFSEAARIISTNKNLMRESVYYAYVDHLSDINVNDLPEDMQIIYESVEMRLNSTKPPGNVGDEEAGYLAKDILFIADGLKAQCRF